MKALMPPPTPENKQCTPPQFKDLGRLIINVEVWYNSLPTMGCDVGAAINHNLEKLWPGLKRDSFPWGIYYKEEEVELEDTELEDLEIEDDNTYHVRVMLQFKPQKALLPMKDEASRLSAIQNLCKALLDTTNKPFAQIPNVGSALHWKPSTRKPMSWDDQRFGAAFCLQVLASIDCRTLFPKLGSRLQRFEATRNPKTKYFGPCQSMLLFEDFKILFEHQINHLQEIFPGDHINPVTGMTQNAEDTVLYILKSCVPSESPLSGLNVVTAFPAYMFQDSTQLMSLETDRLESELKKLMEIYKTNTMEATRSFRGIFQPTHGGTTLDQGKALQTMKNFNTSMQLTGSLYQGSKELESRHSQKLWDMGITAARDTGLAAVARMSLPTALGAAQTALAEAGFTTTAAILAEMGFTSAAGTSSTISLASGGAAAASSFGFVALAILVPATIAMVKVWKEKKKAENVSKAIFESGARSHELWLFMIVYHMRQSGVVTDNDATFMHWANRMASVFSVSVKQDWNDLTYIQEGLLERVAHLEETLKDISMDDDVD